MLRDPGQHECSGSQCQDGVNQSYGAQALVESGAPVETVILVDTDGVNQSCGLNESGTQGLPSLPELESVLTAHSGIFVRSNPRIVA